MGGFDARFAQVTLTGILRHPDTVAAIIGGCWVIWLGYWLSQARAVKRTTWQQLPREAVPYRIAILVAALLMAVPALVPGSLRAYWLSPTPAPLATGLTMVVAGLAFTIWARMHLGRNWSGSVTLKAGHTLVRSGPYRFVRHPIYTGLLLAFAGTVVANGQWRALLALGFAVIAVVRKSRIEEQRMAATFPEYASYRQTTASLIPFVY